MSKELYEKAKRYLEKPYTYDEYMALTEVSIGHITRGGLEIDWLPPQTRVLNLYNCVIPSELGIVGKVPHLNRITAVGSTFGNFVLSLEEDTLTELALTSANLGIIRTDKGAENLQFIELVTNQPLDTLLKDCNTDKLKELYLLMSPNHGPLTKELPALTKCSFSSKYVANMDWVPTNAPMLHELTIESKEFTYKGDMEVAAMLEVKAEVVKLDTIDHKLDVPSLLINCNEVELRIGQDCDDLRVLNIKAGRGGAFLPEVMTSINTLEVVSREDLDIVPPRRAPALGHLVLLSRGNIGPHPVMDSADHCVVIRNKKKAKMH